MIVVLGSWSGGTSAAIRMLEAAGAKLGAVEEHGEALELGRVCRKYVEEPSRNWLDPQPNGKIASNPYRGATNHNHLVALQEVLAVLERLEAFGVDAVKHPGLTHLWRYLPERYRLLFVYRDENEIIHSMHRRGWWKQGRSEAAHAELIGTAVNTWKNAMPGRGLVGLTSKAYAFDYSEFKAASPEDQRQMAHRLAKWYDPATQPPGNCAPVVEAMVKVVR